MGSVKDLRVLKKPEGEKSGIGIFEFSNRYSVFDWGEMPDEIEDKGTSLCLTTSYFFEILEKNGIKTHYLGVIEEGESKSINDIKSITNRMKVKLLRVIKPVKKKNGYDYSVYKEISKNFLIPIEVVFRNSIPQGSSFLKRIKEKGISLSEVRFPVVEFFTKLEETDRFIEEEEASFISNLNKEKIDEIKELTLKINRILKEVSENASLKLEDGKIEFGIDENGDLIVVDAIGTLDECRYSFDGVQLSKEILRIHYRKTEWYKEIEEAKKIDSINWKLHVNKNPEKLPEDFKKLVEDLYRSFTNRITGRNFFNSPSLEELIEEIRGMAQLV